MKDWYASIYTCSVPKHLADVRELQPYCPITNKILIFSN